MENSHPSDILLSAKLIEKLTKGFYKNESPRLQNWDYGSNGYYFVTICVQNNQNLLGEISNVQCEHAFVRSDHDPTMKPHSEIKIWTDRDPSLHPSRIGGIAKEYWEEIPKHFSFVELDAFVIMPNHVHGILKFMKPDKTLWTPNRYTSPTQNLGSIIRQYKGSVKRYANQNNIEFAWHNGYFDKIIHNSDELYNIRKYILNNPQKWIEKYGLPKTNPTSSI